MFGIDDDDDDTTQEESKQQQLLDKDRKPEAVTSQQKKLEAPLNDPALDYYDEQPEADEPQTSGGKPARHRDGVIESESDEEPAEDGQQAPVEVISLKKRVPLKRRELAAQCYHRLPEVGMRSVLNQYECFFKVEIAEVETDEEVKAREAAAK